jgi:hypothetical protein
MGNGIGIGLMFDSGKGKRGNPTAYARADAPTPSIIASKKVSIPSVVASTLAQGIQPTTTTGKSVTVTSSIATATLSTLSPVISALKSVMMKPQASQTQITFLNPLLNVSNSLILQPTSVSAMAQSLIPALSIGAKELPPIASTTASTLPPTVSTGGTTSHYLQLNGTSDYLKTPTITYTKVVVDALVNSSTALETYFIDANNRSSGGYIRFTNTGSIQNNMNQTGLMLNSRTVTTGTLAAAFTGNLAFFARNDGAEKASGNLYDIKIYNGTTLVAWYDMTTGTVNDQSGNGNNATLTGGTWIAV